MHFTLVERQLHGRAISVLRQSQCTAMPGTPKLSSKDGSSRSGSLLQAVSRAAGNSKSRVGITAFNLDDAVGQAVPWIDSVAGSRITSGTTGHLGGPAHGDRTSPIQLHDVKQDRVPRHKTAQASVDSSHERVTEHDCAGWIWQFGVRLTIIHA